MAGDVSDRQPRTESRARHLYVHLPFCSHRCGYCDFVTVAGRPEEHDAYVDAVLTELARESHVLAPRLETVFVGGGTPTYTAPLALERLLDGPTRGPARWTVEANPESLDPSLAKSLRRRGVSRVSVGAQSFSPRLLGVLDRVATPDDVRDAVHHLRDAGYDNISLDLLYGIPGQGPADLEHDLAEALALDPEHLSCYELEAKPGTRFTHAWSEELARQAEALEGHFEHVVGRLTGAGYRWYETANFCRATSVGDGEARAGGTGRTDRVRRSRPRSPGEPRGPRPSTELGKHGRRGRAAGGARRDTAPRAEPRDLRAHHNLAVWRGADYLGVGIGAVSTLGTVRRRNGPSLRAYVAALGAGSDPPREVEIVDRATRARERLMLALRLDEPVSLDGLEAVLDRSALERLRSRGLVVAGGGSVRLTDRGRFLGGGVAAELIDWGRDEEVVGARIRSG